ncbi:MAG: quinone-dependent dihydroorotate dehydrogenase [Micromonosporaceae bacterium]
MTPYRRLVRPLLFRIGGGDAETAHERALAALERLSGWPRVLGALRRLQTAGAEPRTVFGVRFPSPVGLAAGMDKDGRALPAWPALGFGFVEVGTVTGQGQPGNPKPRLFRLPASEAIVNRMGFNNHGAQPLAERLAAQPPLGVPLGISLGKSKAVPAEDAVADYLRSLRALYPHGDYFAINVSSPNTPGLRDLQDRAQLSELLAALQAEAETSRQASRPVRMDGDADARPPQPPPRKPLLVKIAPDLTDHAIAALLEVCQEHGVAGLIAVNTTIGRQWAALADQGAAAEPGGLSGAPLRQRAREVVRFISRETGGTLPVIGVGGIGSADDALAMFDAGASLVQLFTGLIYRGPGLVRHLNRAIGPSVPTRSERV